MRKLLALMIILCAIVVKAGTPSVKQGYLFTSSSLSKNRFLNHLYYWNDTIPTINKGGLRLIQRSTKLMGVVSVIMPEDEAPVETNRKPGIVASVTENRKALLKISGNILYDVNYRSRIDTPYVENNVFQHTLQTRIDILYKDQYPLKVYLTSRFSNSPLFRNYTDFNLKFNPSDFQRIAKQQLLESAKRWIANKTNSKLDSLYRLIGKKKQKLDTLQKELERLENQYRKIKSLGEHDIADFKKQIDQEKDINKLADKLQQLNLPDTALPKGYKMLSGIQSLSIGRSIADYSELSVKNISITGLQAEYNTNYYYAIAAGKVDYRFRDYIVPNHTRSNQYLALVRFGKGTRNGNHIFLTYYTGKRQLYNASVAMQGDTRIPGYNLAGITIEGVYKINRNITVIGEIAKSTIPYYSLDSLQRNKWMSSIGKISSRSNEAYSLKVFSYFPKTYTRFSGNVTYTGANFQSFSTFTTGAAQLRWMARLEQPFFKKQFTVISSLQRNNYSNPFVATAYKSSSLLTSIQANLHIKKYPVISLGYFPAYQLTKAGDDYYSESRYYTLTGSAGYSYQVQQTQLSSYVIYSRFYNEAMDSGFVYYNSKNLLLSQTINFSRFSILINGSLSTGGDYTLKMLENSLQVSLNKIISVGGGLKMVNYSLLPALQWGYSGSLTLNIPKVGDIQLMADKGFIPGFNKQLAENKTGRLIYYKTF